MEYQRHTIGAHTTYSGQYTHLRNARDYQQVKERASQLTRRQSRDHSSRKERRHIFMQRQHMKHSWIHQLIVMKRQVTLITMRTLTSLSQVTHQKTAIFLDLQGMRKGDKSHLMQPNLIYWFIGNKFEIG